MHKVSRIKVVRLPWPCRNQNTPGLGCSQIMHRFARRLDIDAQATNALRLRRLAHAPSANVTIFGQIWRINTLSRFAQELHCFRGSRRPTASRAVRSQPHTSNIAKKPIKICFKIQLFLSSAYTSIKEGIEGRPVARPAVEDHDSKTQILSLARAG